MRLSMPIVILEDNKAAIDWSNKSTSTQRMRHVERSLYWIRQFVANKNIVLKHIKTEDQLADIGTKPLSVSAFKSLSQRIVSYYI
jgi:histone deacetylase 1/2